MLVERVEPSPIRLNAIQIFLTHHQPVYNVGRATRVGPHFAAMLFIIPGIEH